MTFSKIECKENVIQQLHDRGMDKKEGNQNGLSAAVTFDKYSFYLTVYYEGEVCDKRQFLYNTGAYDSIYQYLKTVNNMARHIRRVNQ